MSIINDKVRSLPEMGVDPPGFQGSELPLPTMDPPLPKMLRPSGPPKKSNRGFPFRIPRIFLNVSSNLVILLILII